MANFTHSYLLCGEVATLKTAEMKGYTEPDQLQIHHCESCKKLIGKTKCLYSIAILRNK